MELLSKIRKNDRVKLLKCDVVKKFIKENSLYLNRYNISLPIKKDEDYFYFEVLIETLKNKEVIEGSFVKSFDDMYDYWQTLTYEEKKRMINTDLEKNIQNLKYVLMDNQKYYVPVMNDKINAIYEKEMVLFELKQYNKLRFDCKDMIDQYKITLPMVQYHFTSLEYIQGNEEDYWCYCKVNHLIYHFVNSIIEEVFPIIGFNGNIEELIEFVSLYQKDEITCTQFLIEKKWISEKMIKKMEKILRKVLK